MFPKVAELLPHEPPMVLLERVVESDEDRIVCELCVAEDTLLVRDGRLSAVVSLELMAQAIGAWVGLKARREGKPAKIGFLVGCNEMRLFRDAFELGAVLHAEARFAWGSHDAAHFSCTVRENDEVVAEAGLSVYQPDSLERILP